MYVCIKPGIGLYILDFHVGHLVNFSFSSLPLFDYYLLFATTFKRVNLIVISDCTCLPLNNVHLSINAAVSIFGQTLREKPKGYS